MVKYIIGIDIGTSGTKSVLFDLHGNVVSSALEEYPLYQPQNGWAEQDPEDWWIAVCKTLKAILPYATNGEIGGIGLSGQMHGLVLLDSQNQVLRKAILWCDGRTGKQCRDMERILGHERLIEITANPALEGFTASKILWVKENEPSLYDKCRKILLPKDYIRWKLTGIFATDASDASGTQLLNIAKRNWSQTVCRELEIDLSLLPDVYESPQMTGCITAEAASCTGLKMGIPVAAGAGDNAASAIGTGVCQDGKAFTTMGTSGVIFAHTSKMAIDPQGRIHTFCCAVPGAWHVMGVTQACGLSLNWFRQNFAEDLSYRDLDQQCQEIPIGSERLLYLPYLMGERSPILNAQARGVFLGLSAMHTRTHLARSVMEGVSYSLYDCLQVLKENKISVEDMILCGGGTKSSFWSQMIADVYNLPIKILNAQEGAALGAAILGGCAANLYRSVEEGANMAAKGFSLLPPNSTAHEVYMKYYRLYHELYPKIKGSFEELQQL